MAGYVIEHAVKRAVSILHCEDVILAQPSTKGAQGKKQWRVLACDPRGLPVTTRRYVDQTFLQLGFGVHCHRCPGVWVSERFPAIVAGASSHPLYQNEQS